MFCVKCGKELNDDWKVCPYCQTKVIIFKEEENETIIEETVSERENVFEEQIDSAEQTEFRFSGTRRTGRFSFKSLDSIAVVNGNHIKVTTNVKKKKSVETSFKKQDITTVTFPIVPVIGAMDIVRFIIFTLLIPISYGGSIFALMLFIKFTLVRHVRIQLRDGRKVQIPIEQKADTVSFLREIGYPKHEVDKIESSRVSEKRLSFIEWITTVLLLVIAVAALTLGMQAYSDNIKNVNDSEYIIQDDRNNADEYTMEDYLADCIAVDMLTLKRNPDVYIGKHIIIEGWFSYTYDILTIGDWDESGFVFIEYDDVAYNEQLEQIGRVLSSDYGYVAGEFLGDDKMKATIVIVTETVEESVSIDADSSMVNQENEYDSIANQENENMLIGNPGTYICGTGGESGLIEVYMENGVLSIVMGTNDCPGILGSAGGALIGEIIDSKTVVVQWCDVIFTLTWDDPDTFYITRDGITDFYELDMSTDGVYYSNTAAFAS